MTKIVVVSTAPIFPTNNGYKSSVLGRIDELLNEGNEVVLIEINLEKVTEKKDELIPTRFNNVQRYEVKKYLDHLLPSYKYYLISELGMNNYFLLLTLEIT